MAIAVVKSGIPRPLANYNEAFVVDDLVFAAGQLASDFKTGVPPEARKKDGFPFYGSDIELQTTYVLENLKRPSRPPARRSITWSRHKSF